VCAVSGKGTAGRRTVKVLPRPGPSLEVCTTTAMQFNQLTDQGETDAETVRPAIRTAPALHEEVKHARKNIRRDPIAVVPNLADGIAILAVHPDANRAACWRVFQGIADQVHKDLFKSDRIRVEQDGLGLDRDLVLLAFVFEVEGADAVSARWPKSCRILETDLDERRHGTIRGLHLDGRPVHDRQGPGSAEEL